LRVFYPETCHKVSKGVNAFTRRLGPAERCNGMIERRGRGQNEEQGSGKRSDHTNDEEHREGFAEGRGYLESVRGSSGRESNPPIHSTIYLLRLVFKRRDVP
jgi:hypothetical protein